MLPARRFAVLALLAGAPLTAQDTAAPTPPVARIEITPANLTLDVNDSASVTAIAYDSSGNRITAPVVFFSSSRRSVGVDAQSGAVMAYSPGEFRLFAYVPGGGETRGEIPVVVRWPAVTEIRISGSPSTFYAGTTVRHEATVIDASGAERDNVPVSWSSGNDDVVQVDRFGGVTAVRPGTAELRVSGGGINSTRRITVVANPARSLSVAASANSGRTGDVIHFTAVARDANGRPVEGLPVIFSVKADVEDTVIASAAPAQVDQKGRFVANRAGNYTVFATAGDLAGSRTVDITHRYHSMRMSSGKGQGQVNKVHTSDIWVWEGSDGRDYAVTGTWGADGVAYFWDVTDPANPVRTDSMQVDARTVNDVKVDAERGICVITREGASNRKNGLVVLDCGNPRDVQILSRFDEGLFGGVHNVFIWNQHVFAINAGTRFDIISIEDPRNPKRVSFFELDTPGHGIHDVWVVDGVAYASQWHDGVILVDVGGGKKGGSLANPVYISSYKYPIGATHSAFPYESPTGKFYVFVGDEQFPYGLNPDDASQAEAGGYIHIVDFSDIDNPEEVARYQVPEAGPHNFWIQNDTLYVAYYNAGLRVVDVSGELRGNLYDQGRELVRFRAVDPNGIVANTAFAWGPQPHKGHVFFSDFNSGLWAVQLPPREETLTP